MSKIYLINTDDVKAVSQINYNVDDTLVSAAIRTSQDIYLRDIIGDRLLESVKEKVADGSIEEVENAAYLELLDEYIFNYLAYQANVEICTPISFKLRNMGITQSYDSNIQAAQMETIKEVEDYYRTQSIDRCNRMIKFLLANKDAFPELGIHCICGEKEPNLKLRANTQIYLGF